MEDLRARAPPDAIIDWDQHGSLLTITTTLSREGLHARLVVTCDTAPFRVLTEQLFRWDDGQNPDQVEVTKEASRDGKLRVDWRMPDTLTDLERLHRIEAPGLLYGFMPFHLTPYLRDQTLGIKNPELRMRGAALQQTLRAISKVNADLVETGVFSALEGAQGLASLARPATGAVRPLASGADEPPRPAPRPRRGAAAGPRTIWPRARRERPDPAPERRPGKRPRPGKAGSPSWSIRRSPGSSTRRSNPVRYAPASPSG